MRQACLGCDIYSCFLLPETLREQVRAQVMSPVRYSYDTRKTLAGKRKANTDGNSNSSPPPRPNVTQAFV